MTKVLLLLSLLSLPLLAAEILVISSYHQSNQWDQSYSAGLEQHLKQAHHLGYLYLDTKRQPGQTRDELLAKGMAAYRTHQPALVILGDDNAINALARPIAARGTPVVFLGMNENPRPKGLVGHPLITGVLERPLLKRSISEMSQLMGGLERALVLFDEIEKAHPDVFNVLLQVLDDGRLTDGQGRTVDFKNTVIVMTSNIGSHLIQAMVGQDSDDIKEAVWGELKNHFRPEFLNRIDETVVFHALDAQHIASIAKIQLQLLQTRLAKMDLELQVSDAALAELAKVGFDPVFGARPLKRAIQQRIENPLSKLLLEGQFPPKSVIPVTVNPVLEPGVFQFGEAVEEA